MHYFRIYSNDGSRLKINNKVVINHRGNCFDVNIDLTSNNIAPIELIYFEFWERVNIVLSVSADNSN